MAAGLQQGQHQRGELVAHRDAGEADARGSPGRPTENEGLRASLPSSRTLTLGESAAMSASSSRIWRAASLASSEATSSIGVWSFSR
jgi:hypothetical protein